MLNRLNLQKKEKGSQKLKHLEVVAKRWLTAIE